MDEKLIYIYTDGACRGNPGPGGWGAVLECGDYKKEICGGSMLTTNNIMELTAVIEALKIIKKESKIIITTDSKYVQHGITDWINNWKVKGWKTANKKPVKNKELWQELDQESQKHEIKWEWIKGHSGHFGNEKADQLANEALDQNNN